MPLLMERQGWPAWAIGLNVAMGPIGILIAGPFMPKYLGHVGTRRAAFALVGILVLSLAAISVSPIWLWFPLRFIFGLATSALFTISETWVLSFATRENRGRVMGLYTSLLAVTFAVGPLILPWTGMDGFLPWGIGIACIIISILPLAFVKVEDETFRQKEGEGGFFAFIRKAPMLLFAVTAATLFDNVLISFFTIYGIRSGLELAHRELDPGLRHHRQCGDVLSHRLARRPLVAQGRDAAHRGAHRAAVAEPARHHHALAGVARHDAAHGLGLRRLCGRTRHAGRPASTGRT